MYRRWKREITNYFEKHGFEAAIAWVAVFSYLVLTAFLDG